MKLLKELMDLNEASKGNFVIALWQNQYNKLIGYYVADDKEVTKNIKKAFKYDTKANAEAEAKLNNSQWDLDRGETFVVKPIEDIS